jgi:hypothetical protein
VCPAGPPAYLATVPTSAVTYLMTSGEVGTTFRDFCEPVGIPRAPIESCNDSRLSARSVLLKRGSFYLVYTVTLCTQWPG